jgi:hypothetical protein
MKIKHSFLVIAFSALVMHTCASASSDTPTAGDVYFDCLLAQAGAKGPRGGMCSFAIWGFTEGYTAGVAQGASTAMIYDEKASNTVGGLKDLQERLARIRKQALCLPEGAILIVNFMQYMEGHPEKNNRAFREAMRDMLKDTFSCS